MILRDVKKGSVVKISGREWEVLGNEGTGVLCLSHEIICNKAFDEDNCNDWRKSSLRKYLNDDFLKTLDVEPEDYTIDLTTDDGLDDYKNSTDKVFLLSADLYRKYRKYIQNVDDWWWLVTGHSSNASNSNSVRCVYTDGSLYNNAAYNGNGGVRPACIFPSDIKVGIDIDIIKKSIEWYGETEQLVVCMEELSELIQAISKYIRGFNNKDNLTEEIADVKICCEMLQQICRISESEVQKMIKEKQDRIGKMMKEV